MFSDWKCAASVNKVTLRKEDIGRSKNPATCEAYSKKQNSAVWGLIMAAACLKAKLLKMHMYANRHTHTQPQTCWCIYTFSHTANCALRGMLLPPIRLSLSPFRLHTHKHSHRFTHTHTYPSSLSMQLKGPSLQGFWSRGGLWQWMQITPPTHTLTHTDTNTHTQTHTHSFLCQIPLLTVPPTTLNGKGREEKEI